MNAALANGPNKYPTLDEYAVLREVIRSPWTSVVQHARHSVRVVHAQGKELERDSIY